MECHHLGRPKNIRRKRKRIYTTRIISMTIEPCLYDFQLSDVDSRNTVSGEQAELIFDYFKHHPLFNWANANNGCEGRADAVCVLLDAWGIPNYKAWAFSAGYLKNGVGELVQNWKYHVAPVLAVEDGDKIIDYVLDPSTGTLLKEVREWAESITKLPHSYYFIRKSEWYIFPGDQISKRPWHGRNSQNRKWMIQCLGGINSLTATGRAHLCFNKNRLKQIVQAFTTLKQELPSFIMSSKNAS